MSSPPAGWHADPGQSGQLRYWDGRQWTDQFRPAEPHGAPGPGWPPGPGLATERVHAKGMHAEVTFDGSFITITRSGWSSTGRGEKRIPVGSVVAVDWKSPSRWTSGYIQFTIPGAMEVRRQRGKNQTDSAREDENSVVFDVKQEGEFLRLRRAIDAKVGSGQASAASAVSVPSVADELRKLSELRDAGVLSSDEFEAQKRRLLA